MPVTRRAVLGGLAVSVLHLDPSAAAPTPAAPGFRDLEAKVGHLKLRAPDDTVIWGYGGMVPGPLLRIRLGATLKLRLVNALTQPTTIHWHGVRTVNAMDGVAGLTQPPVAPGARFDYAVTPPDAGLFWYHPHTAPHVAEQVGRGLYGVLIVDEPTPPAVDEDILVVLDDWALDAAGQIESGLGAGRPGALLTLGGTPVPLAASARPGARLRVRLLNACGARIAVVGTLGATATVIAIDGQPSELFQPARDSVPIGPGARFELMLDMPGDAGAAASLVLRGDGEPDRPLMVWTIEGARMPTRGPVAKLPADPLLPTQIHLERSLRRSLVIESASALAQAPAKAARATDKPGTVASAGARWTINGAASQEWSKKPLFAVERGRPVSLAFVNKTAVAQQMCVHGHVFRVLHDLDDGWDPYWRDSILLAPGKTKHIAFIADNPGKWAIASTILDRQDAGLATWFEVG